MSDEYEDFNCLTNSEIEENEEDLAWDSDWEDDEEFYKQVDHDSHVSNMMKHGTQKLTYPFRGFTKDPDSITPKTFLAPFDPALPSTSGTSYQQTNKVQPLSAVNNMAPFDPALPSTSGTPYQHSNKVQPLSAVNMAPFDPALPSTSGTSYQHSNKVQPLSAVNMAPFDPALPSTSGTSYQNSNKVQPLSAVNMAPFDPALPSTSGTSYQYENKSQPLSAGSGQTQKRQYHSIAETQQECNDIVQVEKKPRVEELQNNATCEITESTNAIGGNDEGSIVIVQEDLIADEEDQKSEDGGNEGDSIGAEENVVNSDETQEEKNGSPQIAAAVTENPGTEKASGNTDENPDKTEVSDAETKLSQDLKSSEANVKTLQESKAAAKCPTEGMKSSVEEEDCKERLNECLMDEEVKFNNNEAEYQQQIQVEINDEEAIWNQQLILLRPQVESETFQLGRQINSGGFGRIFNGVYENTPVAVKIVHATPKTTPSIRIEEEVMQKISHHNVIRLLKSFHTFDLVLFVMPLAERSLQDLLEEEEITEERAKAIFGEIILGVAEMHKQGFTHRDLKCDNILLFGETPVLCDFGISCKINDGKCRRFSGTSSHRAPEIFRKVEHDPVKSDIWSLGIILYNILSKTLPFKDTPASSTDKARSLKYNVINGRSDPKPFATMSASAKDLIERILKVNPEDRISLDGIICHRWFNEKS